METLRAFVNRNRIRMSADWADKNPHMNSMPAGSSHYKCTLRKGRLRMTVYFSQGPAIHGEPEVQDVLNCLASEASSYENARSFEDWAGEFGYDTDARKAEKTYRTIEKQSTALKRLLNGEYENLLYRTEQL